MFTSCGWFFYDLSGIETIQVLKYAARVIELSGSTRSAVATRNVLEMLAQAKSNIAEKGTGADIYVLHAEPSDSWSASGRTTA